MSQRPQLSECDAGRSKLVRKKGLEPLQPFGYQLLRLARLPIPPLPLNHTLASAMLLLNTHALPRVRNSYRKAFSSEMMN